MEAINKRKITVTILSLVLTVGLLVTFSIVRNRSNARRSEAIAEELIGKTFAGKTYSFDAPEGSFVSRKTVLTEMEFKFNPDGTVTVNKVVKTDYDGTIIVIDGVDQYDSVEQEEYNYNCGEVTIDFFGKIVVRIGNKNYEIDVNGEDHPISISWNGSVYSIK